MKVTVWDKSIQDARLKSVLHSTISNCPKGWEVSINYNDDYTQGADLDVIFGSWKNYDAPHHKLKRQVVKNCKQVLVLETPLINRGPVHEVCQDTSFRVGLNGFMKNAVFADIDADRVDSFGLPECMPEPVNGDYILLPLQLPGDASLDGIDINEWTVKTLEQLRELTDRKIVIRTPQLNRNYDVEKFKKFKQVYFQKGTYKDKQVTLDNAYAVVTYSSGMSVEAILNGNRTYVDSRWGFKSETQGSLKEVLEKDYENFEDDGFYQDFLYSVCQTQWSDEEIKKGLFWKGFSWLNT